jgi:hypothetical protein
MKYLFFDIECSNCFNGVGKMCEFGYVLTDENFLVMKTGDIPMSPGKGRESRFYLKGRKHEKDLELAYEYDYYLEQPEFPCFYKKIKELVEDPDTICFAYSMDNDIPHLYHACKRYKLQPYNYECYDVQKLVAAYLEKKGQMSLHKACQTIVGPNSVVRLQEHLSRDDAEMERLIFEAICILTKMDSKTLLKESQFARTNSIEWMDKFVHREKKKRLKTAGHELYNSLAVDESELDKPENVGRRYNISGELKADLNALKVTINLIQSKNGILCNKISKSDFFIVYDDKNKEEILKSFKHPFDGQVLTYQEFLSTITK